MKILIVGAGLTGAVLARQLAEKGYEIDVIDSRDHVAGNCHDVCMGDNIVHAYGPHLFHHSDDGVHQFLSRFCEFVNYEHKVKADVNGKLISFPINYKTLEQLYGFTDDEAKQYMLQHRLLAISRNCEELFKNSVGEELSEIFFSPYTTKMWGKPPKEISCSIGARIPIRLSRDDRYFDDKYQYLPKNGYTEMTKNILDHENITVLLNTPFDYSMETDYDHIFNSMSIDEYYGFSLGKLPYRSLNIEVIDCDVAHDVATVNSTTYTGHTRYTTWKNIPGHGNGNLVTFEYPTEYNGNNERYYPTTDGKEIYERYAELSHPKMTFIGRTGKYQYIDMWKAIRQALDLSEKF